jgi:hypothetical protein
MFVNTYDDYRWGVLSGINMDPVWLFQGTQLQGFVNYVLTNEFPIHSIHHCDNNPQILCLQMKVLARRNDSHPLKIHTESSDGDSDFVHPPLRRNKGPEQEPCNPPPDWEVPSNKAQKVMWTIATIHNKHGCLHTVLCFVLHNAPCTCSVITGHQLQRITYCWKYHVIWCKYGNMSPPRCKWYIFTDIAPESCFVVTCNYICCKDCTNLIYTVYHDKYSTIVTHHATF